MKKISTVMFACVLALGAFASGPGPGAAAGQDGSDLADFKKDILEAPTDSARSFVKPADYDSIPELPPFRGDFKILAARPVYAPYDGNVAETRWVSAMAELCVYYKIASLPRTHVFPMEEVDGALPGSRDHGYRLKRPEITRAARNLGATHIIFQEYQPAENGRDVVYTMELYRVLKDSAGVVWKDAPPARDSGRAHLTVVERADTAAGEARKYFSGGAKFTETFIYPDFERGLDALLNRVAGALDSAARRNSAVFSQSVWGGKRALIESLGKILADEGAFTPERAIATYAAAGGAVRENLGLAGVRYAAALLAGRAGDYPQAIDHINAVIAVSGNYPALRLRLAEYLRGAGRYQEAEAAAGAAARSPALKIPAAMEMAMVHQARDNYEQARAAYGAIILGGEANVKTFLMAAYAAIFSNDTAGSEDYMRRAAASGFGLSANEYYELGTVYSLEKYYEKAIGYLKKSLDSTHSTQSRERTWLAIADAYRHAGQKEEEAQIYIDLFRRNMSVEKGANPYAGKLKLAGGIYDSLGRSDRAKDVYYLFLNEELVDTSVSMSLARIHNSRQECGKVRDVLMPYAGSPEAKRMLRECGYGVGNVSGGTSVAVQAMRISTSTLVALGIFGGVIYNERVRTESGRYRDYGTPQLPTGNDAEYYAKVQEMRKNIDSYILTRNLFYALSGVGSGLFLVTFLF